MKLSIKIFAAAAAMLSLTACGVTTEQACENYVAAIENCYGDDFDSSAFGSTCDAYTTNVQASTDLLVCYTAAYDDGDCTTTEGITAVSTGITDCAGM